MSNGQPHKFEINELAKEESWRLFRIMGELVEGFDKLSGIEPAVSIYGASRLQPGEQLYLECEEIAFRLGQIGFNIVTGGGPGVMEAANKGARRAGVISVGLNITLPEEQVCNPFATRSITFDHFFVRKIMLVKYACAFIIMPGGMGTLDEITEVLTLIQTMKIKPFPVILYNSEFWKGFIDWMKQTVLGRGFITEDDLNLLRVSDKVDEVVDAVQRWYTRQEIIARKALRY